MALGVHSEGGKLRKVLICRLGLEHSASPLQRGRARIRRRAVWGDEGQGGEQRGRLGDARAGVDVYPAEGLLSEALVSGRSQGLDV